MKTKYVAPNTEFVKLNGRRAVLDDTILGGGSGGTHNHFAKPFDFDMDEDMDEMEDMENDSVMWE
jgi:hypothetical protein